MFGRAPPLVRRRLLFPPPGCAYTSDASSLGSCRSEPSGAVGSLAPPDARGKRPPLPTLREESGAGVQTGGPRGPRSWGRPAAAAE